MGKATKLWDAFFGKKKVSDAEPESTGVREEIPKDFYEEKRETVKLKAFLKGKVIPLRDVDDGIFSEGAMGDGLAILPESEYLYAPADAEVVAITHDSCHACGLKLANGMKILLHIGIDTVDMQGDGFEYLVDFGDKVKAGTALIHFSREKIKAAGHSDVTLCIITNPGEAKNIRLYTGMDAEEKKTVIVTFEE